MVISFTKDAKDAPYHGAPLQADGRCLAWQAGRPTAKAQQAG